MPTVHVAYDRPEAVVRLQADRKRNEIALEPIEDLGE
jgi:hypothetical protein